MHHDDLAIIGRRGSVWIAKISLSFVKIFIVRDNDLKWARGHTISTSVGFVSEFNQNFLIQVENWSTCIVVAFISIFQYFNPAYIFEREISLQTSSSHVCIWELKHKLRIWFAWINLPHTHCVVTHYFLLAWVLRRYTPILFVKIVETYCICAFVSHAFDCIANSTKNWIARSLGLVSEFNDGHLIGVRWVEWNRLAFVFREEF